MLTHHSLSCASSFTDKFPSEKIGSLTRLAEFGSVWTLVFTLVMLTGTFAAPGASWATTFLQSIVFFVAFLINIVAAGAFSQRDRLFSFNSGADAGMAVVSKNLKALEAFLWLDAFFTLFVTIYTFFKHQQLTDEERAERLKHQHA